MDNPDEPGVIYQIDDMVASYAAAERAMRAAFAADYRNVTIDADPDPLVDYDRAWSE